MAVSKGKAFVRQYCWKCLEHSDKCKFRDQEAPAEENRYQVVAMELVVMEVDRGGGDGGNGGGGDMP